MVERTNQRQGQIVSLASIGSIIAASRSNIICHHSNSGIVPPLPLDAIHGTIALSPPQGKRF
jgi:hypothetical protein